MKLFWTITSFLVLPLAILSCSEKLEQPDTDITGPSVLPTVPEPETPEWEEGQYGKDFIWNDARIPQIKICVAKDVWDRFLENCDSNPCTSGYFKCSVVFQNEVIKDSVTVAALRLRDNTDLFYKGQDFRPEGTAGQKHGESTAWNMSNYELSFTKFSSKLAHTLRAVDGIILKSCRNDPSYSRERYCHDLCKRIGLWTAPRNSFCRLSIHVTGDASPVYLGIYQMIEPVNSSYVTDRMEHFRWTAGNTWKCNTGANLSIITESSFTTDTGTGMASPYMLVNNHNTFGTAKSQLKEFIRKINTLSRNDFHTWIQEVCDVRLLMYTFAVSAVTGNWEDYWNMGQNYYMYFNTTHLSDYKVYFIPHRFDVSLGNIRIDYMMDPARQNPYTWGKQSSTLMVRLMSYPDFRQMYTEALESLISEDHGHFNKESGPHSIKSYMYRISFYTANDTGKMNSAKDMTAPWSNSYGYRYNLTDPDSEYNFFKVRDEVIRQAILEESISSTHN